MSDANSPARLIARGWLTQIPFMLWLVLLWMLLWQQVTVLAFLTGCGMAIFVTRVYRLPTIQLSGRVNLLYLAVLAVQVLGSLATGAISVTAQVFDFRRQPGAAIVAVPLRYSDDMMMTHVAIIASLIPGSLIVEADRDSRTLYLHSIGMHTMDDVEKQRADILKWERRAVRALGSPSQYAALKRDLPNESAADGNPASKSAGRGNA